jgi:transposase-like protein
MRKELHSDKSEDNIPSLLTSIPNSKVNDKARRRVFTAEYKTKILSELEACRHKRGAVGELLRREGLYAAQAVSWKKELEAFIAGETPRKRGPKPDPSKSVREELKKLERENARLQDQLRQAHIVIDIQKKISSLLEME